MATTTMPVSSVSAPSAPIPAKQPLATKTNIEPSPRKHTAHSLQSAHSVRNIPSPDELITYVFPDFNAAAYFQKGFEADNEFYIMEESKVTGFDIYLVEQWFHSRKIGTVVATYTGDATSQISVIKFTTVKKQSKFYPLRLQEYLNELLSNHAKIKKMDEKLLSRRNSTAHHLSSSVSSNTTLQASSSIASPVQLNLSSEINEVCFVTNLASLPSNLNLIPITQGDMRIIQDDLIINSNLKKLQCCGRSLYLTTEKISDANEDKFRHMYKVDNVAVPIKFAIRELVNIIQTCLYYFDLLDPKYCDGLLCSKTEEAIMNWWNLIGLPHFNVKPNAKNGILPSRTVAAILSLILSVKLRLQLIGGCDVPKDPFDIVNFMLSIGQFQRQYKLDKTRKLDLETLNKLFSITNTRLLPEKYRNYYPYNHSMEAYDESQTLDGQLGSTLSPISHKKNKSYYGLELKKLTNVVKNTVQDIQAASRDNDDISSGKSSGARIRSKIAKMADNSSPLDVETLDLEVLVRHYITGKTLFRLFYGEEIIGSQKLSGIQKSGDQKDYGHHEYKSGHLSYRNRHRAIPNNLSERQYRFISLRDRIADAKKDELLNGHSTSDISKYSRGFNKMKIGRSNRKSAKRDQDDAYPSSNGHHNNEDNHHLRNHDLELNSTTGDNSQTIGDSAADGKSEISHSTKGTKKIDNPLKHFQYSLNRRNSYPSLSAVEGNLNILEFSKKDITIGPREIYMRKRSSSCPELVMSDENYSIPFSLDKFCYKYISSTSNLIKYDNLVNLYGSSYPPTETNGSPYEAECLSRLVTNSNINKKYNLLNIELIKLRNVNQQMNTKRTKIIDEVMNDLKYNINDLKGTIDRLFYETRIVVKRINELDENSKLLDTKLNDQCKAKLHELISNLISSRKFNEVFNNEKEKRDIIKRLTEGSGSGIAKEASSVEPSKNGILKIIITFIYEMILFIFHLFKFDGTNMNLDRIRQSWVKLDPNRKIINSAYSYVGREPSRTSVTSIDLSD